MPFSPIPVDSILAIVRAARRPRGRPVGYGSLSAAGVAALCGAQAGRVHAQAVAPVPAVPESLTGSIASQVMQRLDPLAIALILVGALILLLLVVRIVQMVRRERPVRRTEPVRTPPRRDDDGLASLTARTDWGFDQNKRSSQTRAVNIAGGSAAPPMLAAGQWSSSEVYSGAQASFQPLDWMGKPGHLPPSPYRTSHNPYFAGESAGTPTAMEVEEVADVLLQAELLVQLGDPKQAMSLLAQHIRDTEEPGPGVWLMLLNLYQTTGRKAQYEALAQGFVTLFNAAVPPWATPGATGERDLETYAQVMMRLQSAWPQPALRPFLEGLLNDDRGGSRQGFTLAAYREILFLIEVMDILERMDREDDERARIQQKLGAPD